MQRAGVLQRSADAVSGATRPVLLMCHIATMLWAVAALTLGQHAARGWLVYQWVVVVLALLAVLAEIHVFRSSTSAEYGCRQAVSCVCASVSLLVAFVQVTLLAVFVSRFGSGSGISSSAEQTAIWYALLATLASTGAAATVVNASLPTLGFMLDQRF